MTNLIKRKSPMPSYKVDDTLFLVYPQEKLLISINEVGLFVWETLKEETSIKQIVDEVVANFDVEQPEADKDVKDFVKKLDSMGLIVQV